MFRSRSRLLPLVPVVLCFLSHGRLTQARNDCQPHTWGGIEGRGLEAAAQTSRPPLPPPQQFGPDGPQAGDFVCDGYSHTLEQVNYYTCTEMAERGELTVEEFLLLNPEIDPDCGNIKPMTLYCLGGHIEPLRAKNGKCGPPHNNATCNGTEKPCCNSQTWTCGDSDEDCAPGICYEGICPGHKIFSTDGKCGPEHGNRRCGGHWGDCCNLEGECGRGEAFCRPDDCVFGNCTTVSGPPASESALPWTFGNTTDGSCGGENAYTCGVVYGNCCNKDGRCGSLPSDCGLGCQPLFGKCDEKVPLSTSFVPANFDKNMVGWKVFDGTFRGTSNKLTVSDTNTGKAVYDALFDDFILDANVALSKNGDGNGGLVFRATELGNGPDAYHGYYVGITTAGKVLLGRADGTWNPLGSSQVSISANQMYHIRVQALGDLIHVFVEDMKNPKMSVRDGTFKRGSAGVRVFRTGATVDNFAVSLAVSDDFATNMANWKTYDGRFDVKSSEMVASDTSSGKTVYVASFQDFVLEANIALTKISDGNAGLIFRATDLGHGPDAYHGYYAGIDTGARVILGRSDGTWRHLATANADIAANEMHAMKVRAVGDLIEVFVDDAKTPKISFRDSTFKTGSAGVRVFKTGARVNSFMVQPVILEKFDNKNMVGWKSFDGDFKSGSGELLVSEADSGKAIYDTTIKDFSLETDITLTKKNSGNAGLIFRAKKLGSGADTYHGYYAGIDVSGWLVLGRADGSWITLQRVQMPVFANQKYHIKVQVIGELIEVFVENMSKPKISVRDHVFTTGAIGVRAFQMSARLENFMVQSR